LSVERLFCLSKVLGKVFNLLLSQIDFILVVRNELFALLDGMMKFTLNNFHIIFVIGGLFTQLLLVLTYQVVHSAGVAFFLVVEALLQTLLLSFVELFQL
jgi:hypothetical protein